MFPVLTIGYQKLQPADLVEIVEQTGALVVDVRTRPTSGRMTRGFRRADLESLLGDAYDWRGDTLGGLGKGPTKAGIDLLAEQANSKLNILLCKEESPGECHRHHLIAVPLRALGIEVWHLFRDEAIEADEVTAFWDSQGAKPYTYSPAAEILEAYSV
jgi:uncharacterized protein (DUF488 family)